MQLFLLCLLITFQQVMFSSHTQERPNNPSDGRPIYITESHNSSTNHGRSLNTCEVYIIDDGDNLEIIFLQLIGSAQIRITNLATFSYITQNINTAAITSTFIHIGTTGSYCVEITGDGYYGYGQFSI